MRPQDFKSRRLKNRPFVGTSGWKFFGAFGGFLNLPHCVWAAPQGLAEVVAVADAIATGFPEVIGHTSLAKDASCSVLATAEGHEASVQPSVLQAPKHCVVYQAGYPCQYLAVNVKIPCTLQDFVKEASDLRRDSAKNHHLVPTRSQIRTGLASLIAVPAWIEHTEQTVYILDFSFWHGPVYAVISWKFVNLSSLADAARLHAQGSWEVTHNSLAEPLRQDQHVIAEPGDVFVFHAEGAQPASGARLEDTLADVAAWDPCPSVVPRERSSNNWLALRSHVTRTPLYAGTSIEELKAIAAEAFHSEAHELDFEFPHTDSPLGELVYRGLSVRGLLAAEPRSLSGKRLGIFVFLDGRLIGRQPSFRFCSDWVDTPL